ncbi:LytR/AlgR family response regulator transcription factor [Enterococcus ureasiticus]|uniref:Two-component system response regulator n=1 Tax=Enterococcus ureasiticus TaxID=903984 RepID=A0A1E5GE82_9ENTE|nr:LytTR family transcriptional regulator DNA-binding domain-containing protein [Enterococcus ureasiticus]OEG11036.1 two-component system response regulator [Enterococcus ureasiticus]
MTINTTIYVVEDDNLYRKRIIHYLENYHSNSFHYKISSLDNHLLFMEDIPTLDISDNDVFFLDIDLKMQYSGIDLANKIREINSKCSIIFLTSFEDKAISIINSEIFPLGYLVKNPIDSAELKATIENVLLKIESLAKTAWRQDQDITTFMNGYESIYLNCKEILYIESLKGFKSRILIKTFSEELIIEGKIGKIKNNLKQSYLFSSLQSYVINLENISAINRKNGTITFTDDKDLFVGTRIIDKVKKGLQEYRYAG